MLKDAHNAWDKVNHVFTSPHYYSQAHLLFLIQKMILYNFLKSFGK